MDERLKREGTKSHKQRVEEYNKYLSNLSEHHDMYASLRTYFENWKGVVANILGFIGRVSDLDNTCWGVGQEAVGFIFLFLGIIDHVYY